MEMIVVLYIAVLLGLSSAARAASGGSFIDDLHSRVRKSATVDFEDWAQRFVERKARENNRYVSWWDLYGNHVHLRERPQYQRYRISVDVSGVRYGLATNDVEKPNVVYTKRWENRMSSPIKVKISKEIQRANLYSWTVDRGISLEYKVNVPAEKPGLFGSKRETSNTTVVSLKKRETQSETEVETLKMEYNLEVKPNTEVRAEWVLTEKEVDVPWEADVYIDGWIAVWYSEKHDGHWLWFYPIYQLAGPDFSQRGNGLVYKASGTFRGVKGIDSDLKTYEKPLEQSCPGSSCDQPSRVSVVQLNYDVPALAVYSK